MCGKAPPRQRGIKANPSIEPGPERCHNSNARKIAEEMNFPEKNVFHMKAKSTICTNAVFVHALLLRLFLAR